MALFVIWNLAGSLRLDLWQQSWSFHRYVRLWVVIWILLYGYLLSNRAIKTLYPLINTEYSASHVIDDRRHVSTLTFSWASAITLLAVTAAFVRTAGVALYTLGPKNEHWAGNSPNTSAESRTLSGLTVSLHDLRAKFSIYFFFSLGSQIRSFRNVRLIGSWYLYPFPSALWFCIPGICHFVS